MDLTDLLKSISVSIKPYPIQREKEKRDDRREKKIQATHFAPTLSTVGPCSTIF